MTDEELRRTYPAIPWNDPITLRVPGVGSAFGCRLCIAHDGIRGIDVKNQPQTIYAFQAHMISVHNVTRHAEVTR